MEGGAAYFRSDVPFRMVIQGTINGKPFSVEGKGIGNATSGTMKGKWECVSGTLPMSWSALAGTLGSYGFKCFAKFSHGIPHFFQECMPEGYTQERITRFQDDGKILSYHEVLFQKDVILNQVTLQGDGFRPNSPVLNNRIECFLPSTETTYPFENGIKSLVYHVYPIKDESQRFLVASQTTVNRPLGSTRIITQPPHHFTRNTVCQEKDPNDKNDHIVQKESVEGYDFKLLPFS